MKFNGAELDESGQPLVEEYQRILKRDVRIFQEELTLEEIKNRKLRLKFQGYKKADEEISCDEEFYQEVISELSDKYQKYKERIERFGFKTELDEEIFKYLKDGYEVVVLPKLDENGQDTYFREIYIRKKDMEKELFEQLKSTQQRLEKVLAQYTLMQDEVKKTKQRLQKDQEEEIQRGKEKFIKKFLPIIDNLYNALEHAKEKDSQIAEGLEMVINNILKTLSEEDIQPIEIKRGQEFDPKYHDAIATQPSDEIKKNYILEVFERGYRIGDRILKAPKVIVSQGKN